MTELVKTIKRSTHWGSCFLLSTWSSCSVNTNGAKVALKNSRLCPITKVAQWKTNNGGVFPHSQVESTRHRHIVSHVQTHTVTHIPNEGLDSSRWKDSAGGCTFIKPRLDLFMFEVIWARERHLCAQTHILHTLSNYPHFSVFTFP